MARRAADAENEGLPYTYLIQPREIAVNHSSLNSKPTPTDAALREFVAAMPIVMLLTAIKAAFKASAAPARAASLQHASR